MALSGSSAGQIAICESVLSSNTDTAIVLLLLRIPLSLLYDLTLQGFFKGQQLSVNEGYRSGSEVKVLKPKTKPTKNSLSIGFLALASFIVLTNIDTKLPIFMMQTLY